MPPLVRWQMRDGGQWPVLPKVSSIAIPVGIRAVAAAGFPVIASLPALAMPDSRRSFPNRSSFDSVP
jgi:hypothetical protein